MIVSHTCMGHRRVSVSGSQYILTRAVADPIGYMNEQAREEIRYERARAMRERGYSIRQISYLTGIPRSTVSDVVRRMAR